MSRPERIARCVNCPGQVEDVPGVGWLHPHGGLDLKPGQVSFVTIPDCDDAQPVPETIAPPPDWYGMTFGGFVLDRRDPHDA